MRSNRNTKQKEIIKKVLNSFDSFFNAQDLFNKIKEENSNIGIATVYRYLKEFEKSEEVFSYVCDRKRIYSLGKKSHCHFICEKTGKIIHFNIDNIDFLKNKIPGTISSFQLEVRGTCHGDSKKVIK